MVSWGPLHSERVISARSVDTLLAAMPCELADELVGTLLGLYGSMWVVVAILCEWFRQCSRLVH